MDFTTGMMCLVLVKCEVVELLRFTPTFEKKV